MLELMEVNDYREVLKAYIKRVNRRGIQGKMARAILMQESQFSAVLKGGAHLSSNHAALIGEFMELSKLEIELFLDLVELSRDPSPILREILTDRIARLRQDLEPHQGLRVDLHGRTERALDSA